MLRLFTVALLAVAGATANHVTNTSLLLSSQTPPIELAYGGGAEPIGPDEIVAVQGIRVHRSISFNLQNLLAAARSDGIVLAGWGWRSHQRQHELRRINGCPDGWIHRDGEKSSDFSPAWTCRIDTARPGSSLHESGLAVDFTCAGRPIAGTACFRWLKRHAARFGFYNLPSEPWHWSVNGR